MAEKDESSASSKQSTSNVEQLEGATGAGVHLSKKRKSKKRHRKSSRSMRARKDDVPACETVEKVTAKSGNETSQSEWLNEVGAAPSTWQSFVGFVNQYKYPLMASVVLAGVLVYVSVKKTRMASKCPFTGKKTA
uniref:Small lysine-rich protein 1 n=1 Tax=Caenorhabditis tropicalis TaxID=1561998 RepID=A0A1I7URC1_9PELO